MIDLEKLKKKIIDNAGLKSGEVSTDEALELIDRLQAAGLTVNYLRQDVENLVGKHAALSISLQSAESQLSTLRAELDNAALQIKFRDGLIESKDEYIALMEAELDKLKEQTPVYLVATGEHYGQHESYTLHNELPALCDAEKLYRLPVPPQQVPEDLIRKLYLWYARLTNSESITDNDEYVGNLCTMAMMDEMEALLSTTPPSDEAK